MKVWTRVEYRWDEEKGYVIDEAASCFEDYPDDAPVAQCGKGGGSSAPSPDPNIGKAALEQAAIGREALEFYKSAYEEMKPGSMEAQRLANEIAQQQIRVGEINEQRAASQWDHYQKNFLPVEERMVQEAMEYDSEDRQQAAAARAISDVAQRAQVQRQADERSLQRMGVNPMSGRFQAQQSTQGLMQALGEVGAANQARQVLRDQGIALRAGAANFGRNMPNTAAQAYGLSIGAGQAGVGSLGAGQAMGQSTLGIMGQGYNTAMAGNQSMANILNQQYGNQVNAWQAQQQANSAAWGGLGALIGTGLGAYAALG